MFVSPQILYPRLSVFLPVAWLVIGSMGASPPHT